MTNRKRFPAMPDPTPLSRRDFLRLAPLATGGLLLSCAKNPVTGQNQLMLVSESQEIALDKKNAPHQFSADYGATQHASINRYLNSVGQSMARMTHRPQMPYSFRCVNAAYVNAYAFPGGSIAATRGILLELDNEAELAALMGHELGHVNARHTASRMSTAMLTQAVVAGAAIAVASQNEKYAPLAAGLGGIGAGLLLAHYSREDERQADALGLEYSARSGYAPEGMVGLMEMLDERHESQPSSFEMLFATHPMSGERLTTARTEARSDYAVFANQPVFRERYMDETAPIRAEAEVIIALQEAQKLVRKKDISGARQAIGTALEAGPEDYTAHVMAAKLALTANDTSEARHHAQLAHEIYPEEPQALQVIGLTALEIGAPETAFRSFTSYEQALPGNPLAVFYQGYSLERAGETRAAAREYYRFLNAGGSGQAAEYAKQRLIQWKQ